MPFSNDADQSGSSEHSGDVTIIIRGPTAARMLGRADEEAQARDKLARGLGQRLETIEEAVRQRADEHERLDRVVQDLPGQLSQLGGQMAAQLMELRGDLSRVREDAGGHDDKLARLQNKLEMAIDGLTRRVADLEAKVLPQTRAGEPADAPPEPPPPGTTGGFLSSAADRLRRMNLSFGLWSMTGALVACGTFAAAALWIYS